MAPSSVTPSWVGAPSQGKRHAPMSRRVRRPLQNPGREPGGAAVGADLGGSSKYSNENFEGRRGERFHVSGVSTINDADQGSADVAYRTPLAPYEKSKSLGSWGLWSQG